MINEKYTVTCEYETFYKNGELMRSYKTKNGSGFKNKEKALARFKDMQENPNNYKTQNSKMVSVKFITTITEEIVY